MQNLFSKSVVSDFKGIIQFYTRHYEQQSKNQNVGFLTVNQDSVDFLRSKNTHQNTDDIA